MKSKKSNQKSVSAKTDEKNANEISSVLSVKKFANLNYEKLNAKEQKRFRSSIRRKLFAIISEKEILQLSKSETKETSKANFETFKKFVKENYNIPFTEVQNVFKGNGTKKISFDNYIAEFKKYLATSKAKKEVETV